MPGLYTLCILSRRVEALTDGMVWQRPALRTLAFLVLRVWFIQAPNYCSIQRRVYG